MGSWSKAISFKTVSEVPALHNPSSSCYVSFPGQIGSAREKRENFFFIFMMNPLAFFSEFGGLELLKVCLSV